jgi:hypothetical protein
MGVSFSRRELDSGAIAADFDFDQNAKPQARCNHQRPSRKGPAWPGIREMPKYSPADRRRALVLLAHSTNGCSEALMLAHGFPMELTNELVNDGLVTAQSEWTKARGREIEATFFRIMDVGRRALA